MKNTKTHAEGKMVVICWHDNLTGNEGEGRPTRKYTADDWVSEMSKEYPHIAYWLRDATAGTEHGTAVQE